MHIFLASDDSMLQFLKNKRFRLGATKKLAKPSKEALFEDVPRYPPFMKGLPVVDAQALLDSQSELVGRIKSVLGYPKEQFESLVYPVLVRYAEFVHLLPASEAHHHRGAGGLFRHGLEVAFWAAQASEGQIFPMEAARKYKAEHENRWRFSAFLAGLSHDLGKPISDMEISDKNGTTTWDPFQCSLLEWATTNRVDRYFVRWRNSRIHKQHENFSLLIFKEIAGRESLSYVAGVDKRTLPALFDAVSGTGGRTEPLTRLAMRADQESVKRDMANNRMEVDENAYGVPVHRYVFDAMRSLINEQAWTVNEAGAKVWMMDGSAFIVWKAAVKDIVRKVQELNVPGVPRDADTLADVLIERGYALRNEVITGDGEVLHYRYWKIQPLDPQNTNGMAFDLLALRLDDAERIFTGVVPSSVKGIIGTADEDAQEKDQPKQGTAAHTSNPTQGAGPNETPEPEAKSQPSQANTPAAAAPNNTKPASAEEPQKDQADEDPAFMPPDLRGVIERLKKNAAPVPPLEAPSPSETESSAESSSTNQAEIPLHEDGQNWQGQEAAPAEHPNVHNQQKSEHHEAVAKTPAYMQTTEDSTAVANEQTGTEKSESDSKIDAHANALDVAQEHLSSLLAKAGEPGLLIDQLIQPIVRGEQWLGQALMKQGHDMVILYPEGLRPLGEPFDIAQALADAGLVVPDPVMQDRLVQVIDDIKVVVLEPALAQVIGNVLEAVRESEMAEDVRFAAPTATSGQKKKRQPSNKRQKVQGKQSKRSEQVDMTEKQPIETDSTVHVSNPASILGVESTAESAEPTIEGPPAWFDELHEEVALAQRPIVADPAPIQPAPKATVEKHPAVAPIHVEDIEPASSPVPAQVLTGPADLGANPAVDEDAFEPKTITAKQAMRELIEMMREGQGRWIVSGVRRLGDNLITSDEALDRIVNEYPGVVSRTQLRSQVRFFGGVCRTNEIHIKVSK